eukprot:scaffold137965_cov17-Tisochrysis_lutea.AAC.1
MDGAARGTVKHHPLAVLGQRGGSEGNSQAPSACSVHRHRQCCTGVHSPLTHRDHAKSSPASPNQPLNICAYAQEEGSVDGAPTQTQEQCNE